jgi:hypothetical protein
MAHYWTRALRMHNNRETDTAATHLMSGLRLTRSGLLGHVCPLLIEELKSESSRAMAH